MGKIVNSRNVVVFFLGLGLLFAVSFLVRDKESIVVALSHMNYSLLLAVLLFTALSYLLLCGAFAKMCLLLGVDLPFKKLFHLWFISTVISNLVSVAGGLTGYTTKIALFKRHEMRVSRIAALTLLFANLNNLALIILLPIGILSLLQSGATTGRVDEGLVVRLGLLILLLLIVTFSVLVGPIRDRVLGVLPWFVRNEKRKSGLQVRITAVNDALDEVVSEISRYPAKILLYVVFITLSVILSVLALGACFYALGVTVPFGVLLTGYAIGVFIGMISVVPGGMGVQEATMAGVFSFLGVNFGVAILAAVIFRLIYNVIPFFYGVTLSRKWDTGAL